MKKLTLSVLALATVASFTACKKGSDDPALSLRTRDSRLAGEWKLSSGEIVKSYRDAGGAGTLIDPTTIETLSKKETYDGTTVTKSAVWSEANTPGTTITKTSTFKGKYEMTLSILKDGTVKVTTTDAPTSITAVTSPANTLPVGITLPLSPVEGKSSFENFDYTNIDGNYNYAASITKSEITGRWSWSDSRKNKVIVNIDGLGTFYVKELRNKTLVLEEKLGLTGSTTATTVSDNSYSSVATWTFKQ